MRARTINSWRDLTRDGVVNTGRRDPTTAARSAETRPQATAAGTSGPTTKDAFGKSPADLAKYAGARPMVVDPKTLLDLVKKGARDLFGVLDELKKIIGGYDLKLAGIAGLEGVIVTGTNWLEQNVPLLGPVAKVIERLFNKPPAAVSWPEPPPPVSANPSLPTEGGKPRVYRPTDGVPLWGPSGPQLPADVRQGGLGDCYFMASVAGLTPEQVKDMIRDNGDGTYTVRLYDVDANGGSKPAFVTVNGDLPDPAAAQYGADGKWAAIIEKAYATHVGGYDVAAGDNNPKFFAAPTVLTGRPTLAYALPVSSPDIVFARLRKAVADGRPAFAGFYGKERDGLVGYHAYTVVGTRVDEATGQRYVVLRNPWGYGELSDADGPRDGKDDGVFELPLEEFMKTYQAVAVAGG